MIRIGRRLFNQLPSNEVQLAVNSKWPLESTRNIGIIAHIDAGKTTLTERMLFYSGYTRRLGDVDNGDTVMDFMQQEQQRGITIQAAAITFGWNRQNKINLIDTPGHADFLVEVQRSLRVLDGAVTVLDSVHGVEAQTEIVWRQADRYQIPRLLFLNKMDREGAAFERSLIQVQSKFCQDGRYVLPCQLPVFVTDLYAERNPDVVPFACANGFCGVVDLVDMELLVWSDNAGTEFSKLPLSRLSDTFRNRVLKARRYLVEILSELDESVMDVYLETEDPLAVDSPMIKKALRTATLEMKCVPAFCGSAHKNIGVQPLLDAVVDYLPSPLDVNPPHVTKLSDSSKIQLPLLTSPDAEKKLCALAFKVVHDPKKGCLTFVRIYSGSVNGKSVLLNARTGKKERLAQVCSIYANELEPISCASYGNIAVLTGLKDTETGDTLLNYPVAHHHKEHLHHSIRDSTVCLDKIDIPPPVFVRSIEPQSTSEEKALIEALGRLQKEDPSIKVQLSSDTGQLLVFGMGELHLEIIIDRLLREYKLKSNIGPVWISYRETLKGSITAPLATSYSLNQMLLGKHQNARMDIEIMPNHDYPDSNHVVVDLKDLQPISATFSIASSLTSQEIKHAIAQGVEAALFSGPLLSFPLIGVKIKVHGVKLDPTTTTNTLSLCATSGVAQAIKAGINHYASPAEELPSLSPCTLLEPLMNVKISVPTDLMGNVMNDLTGARHAHITQLESSTADQEDTESNKTVVSNLCRLLDVENAEAPHEGGHQIIQASVPVSGMVGYSSQLRAMTRGRGQFSMDIAGYGKMNNSGVSQVLKNMRGF